MELKTLTFASQYSLLSWVNKNCILPQQIISIVHREQNNGEFILFYLADGRL